MKKIVLSLLVVASNSSFAGTIKVVTTLTDIAWAAREIGGSNVSVESFLTGSENPHFVDVMPSFVQMASNADVVCSVGLDLEIGWLPKVLDKSGNSKVQSGGKGFCELGKAISPLEKPPGAVNRSMGDMHPAGNPHFWLSPKHLAEASKEISKVLSKVDPKNASTYSKNYSAFKKKLEGIQKSTQAQLASVKAKLSKSVIIEYHKDFSYFFDCYGITSFGSVEEKPGVSPSAGRISEVAADAKSNKVKLVLGTPHSDRKVLNKFKDIAKIKDYVTPISIQKSGKFNNYAAIQTALASAIAGALK
ncbi:MAG: metal ABC transporter substrate-binding protein [Proteobacteria bacterium]|nr:metal ABC transporter substrate-binding protein [Pseudomonadota bacterium]